MKEKNDESSTQSKFGYTTEQLAKLLQLSPGTIRNRLSLGKEMPPRLKIGGVLIFPKVELEKWLEERIQRDEEKPIHDLVSGAWK